MARTLEPAKTPRINFIIPRGLRKSLNDRAEKERRTISSILCELVARYLGKPVK
jgi:hypothetical protein